MPIVRLTTTVKEIPDGLEARMAELIHKLFPHKELSHCFIMASPNTKIYNSNQSPTGEGPLVVLEIQSMNTFKPENVSSAREEFINFVNGELNVEKPRILVAFQDVPDNFAGLGK